MNRIISGELGKIILMAGELVEFEENDTSNSNKRIQIKSSVISPQVRR